jgi:glucose/mannose-6-phosphate isomerase
MNDSEAVEKSLELFPEQCREAWNDVKKITVNKSDLENIIVCGMGGSRFTPMTVKYLFADKIKLPYEIIDGYHLPSYANEKTLVILSSYSGTTEEVISCAKEAIAKGCTVSTVTSGGEIAKMSKDNNWNSYIFNPTNNPSGQPRLGGGYMLMGHVGLLKSYGLLDLSDEEVITAIEFIKNIKKDDQRIKDTTNFMKDKIVYLIASEHLRGFVNGFANQMNENAKAISDFRIISELNHHLMEGLTNPNYFKKSVGFIFIKSNLYSERIQKRYPLTREVVEKQGIECFDLELEGNDKLSQVLEGFVISGYSTYDLSKYYGVDALKIPWVDYFKKALS